MYQKMNADGFVPRVRCRMVCIRRFLLPFFKFLVVGFSGALIDIAVFHYFTSFGVQGFSIATSKIIAAELALANNFLLNEFLIFRPRRTGIRARVLGFIRFNVICSIGTLIALFLLGVQVSILGISPALANCVAIVVVSFWNFGLNVRFNWKEY